MSLHCMPLIISNLGGEMLYILDQRLQAQSIPIEKSKRVLQDVIATMFSVKFVEEMFKPQELYTNASTRQIFDRIAHSSIMRLNESSMDKLYDLMTMGVKYQMLCSTQSSDMLQVTMQHFDVLDEIVKGSDVQTLLDNARALCIERYRPMSAGAWTLLRHTLARFFQDRKVKVSIFLQDGIQLGDGSFNLSCAGALPVVTATPGSIRYYSQGRVSGEQRLDLPNAVAVFKPANEFDPLNAYRSSHLGTNMYAKIRKRASDYPVAAAAPGASPFRTAAPALSESAKKQRQVDISKASRVEMNLLAQLVPIQRAPSDNFTLQLFQDSDAGGGADSRAEIIMFDSSDKKAARTKEIERQMGGFSFDAHSSAGASGAAAASSGDDLLDLLDSAS